MENYLYYDLSYPERVGPFLERWMPVKDFDESYHVSDYGRVKSLSRRTYNNKNSINEKILSTKHKKDWYISYVLCKHNKLNYKSGHVLVAIAFIPNDENKPEVNHKNGIKFDSFVGNLEWCTASENHIHAYRTGLQNCYQSKLILDISTGIFFDNVKQAELQMGLYRGKLTQMILGRKPNTTNLRNV